MNMAKDPLGYDHKDEKGYVRVGLSRRQLAAPDDKASKGKATRKKG